MPDNDAIFEGEQWALPELNEVALPNVQERQSEGLGRAGAVLSLMQLLTVLEKGLLREQMVLLEQSVSANWYVVYSL